MVQLPSSGVIVHLLAIVVVVLLSWHLCRGLAKPLFGNGGKLNFVTHTKHAHMDAQVCLCQFCSWLCVAGCWWVNVIPGANGPKNSCVPTMTAYVSCGMRSTAASGLPMMCCSRSWSELCLLEVLKLDD